MRVACLALIQKDKFLNNHFFLSSIDCCINKQVHMSVTATVTVSATFGVYPDFRGLHPCLGAKSVTDAGYLLHAQCFAMLVLDVKNVCFLILTSTYFASAVYYAQLLLIADLQLPGILCAEVIVLSLADTVYGGCMEGVLE